jgi:hypothetical protein
MEHPKGFPIVRFTSDVAMVQLIMLAVEFNPVIINQAAGLGKAFDHAIAYPAVEGRGVLPDFKGNNTASGGVTITEV